ncbi:MAG: methyltransferase family protein [Alistipes ihumii]
MTLSQSYSALSRKLYALRGRLSLWLLPASVAALLVTTPFRIADGWILLAVCALLLGSGFALRVRSTAVMLYRTRLRASGNPPAMPFPTEGIYARMRYPLYAGNFLIWFGIVLYTGTDWFVIGATALYAACYLTILGREERLMLGKYGADYRARCREVPPCGRRAGAGRRCTGFATVGRAPGVPVAGGAVLVLLLLGIVSSGSCI